jgi:hypothetical protein
MSKMGSHCSFGHLKHKLWPKEGPKSNWQFDSRPEKVGNRPDLLSCKQRATYRWKALDKGYNFSLDRTSIQGLFAKLWGFKVSGVVVGAISGLPRGSPGREKPFRCRPRGEVQSILYGGRWWLPLSPSRGQSCVSVLPVTHPSTKGAPTMH